MQLRKANHMSNNMQLVFGKVYKIEQIIICGNKSLVEMKRKMLEDQKSVAVSKICWMQNFKCFHLLNPATYSIAIHTFIITFFNFSNFTGVDESVKVVKIKNGSSFDLKRSITTLLRKRYCITAMLQLSETSGR